MSKMQKVIDLAKELGGIDITWFGDASGYMFVEKSSTDHRSTKEESLRRMMQDPRYWRDNDEGYIKKVEDGFKELYGEGE